MKESILMTGASGNLGSIVLNRLSDAGYHTLATVRSPQNASELQSEMVEAAVLDLTDEVAVKTYIQEVKEKRNITAAILLAGGFMPGGFLSTDSGALQKMFAMNFETSFFLVRELLPVFEKRGGGQFILIGSRAALVPQEGKNLVAYALSKRLIFQLAEFVNAYGKGKGIDATVIVPSTIDTPTNRQAMPQADFSKWVSPEAIADTIHFTLSDSGRQMRGSILKLYNES